MSQTPTSVPFLIGEVGPETAPKDMGSLDAWKSLLLSATNGSGRKYGWFSLLLTGRWACYSSRARVGRLFLLMRR